MASSSEEMTDKLLSTASNSSNDTSPTSNHQHNNNNDDGDHSQHHEPSSSSSPGKQNKPVNLRQSSNHPLNCSCRSLNRRTYDEVLANFILPFVEKSEWNLDHWDPDALPNSTGSKQLDSFYVLRQIFLFVHFDMETLLAVASVNRAWRCLADRLPHWRYLLPMKYELPDVVSALDWHLPRAWVVERIPYEIGEDLIYKTNYHLTKQNHASRNTADDSKYHHYRLRQIQPTTEDRKFFNSRTTSFQLIRKAWLDEHDINSQGRKTAEFIQENEKLSKEERDKIDLGKFIPKEDYSCATCCLFTCLLPCICCWMQTFQNGTPLHDLENQFRREDFNEFVQLKKRKLNTFAKNCRIAATGEEMTEEDQHYADEAVVDGHRPSETVDWFQRLGGGGGTTSPKKNKEQQKKNPLSTNDNAYEIVDATKETQYNPDEDMDFDYNDYNNFNVKLGNRLGKIEENYDEVVLGSKNINGTWNVDNSNDDWYYHPQRHSSEQQPAGNNNNNSAAAAAASAACAALSSDLDNNNNNNSIMLQQGATLFDLEHIYSGCIAKIMKKREELRYKQAELAVKEAEKGKKSIAGRKYICQNRRFPLSSGEIYHEDWPIVAPTCVYTQLTRSSLAQVDHGGRIKSVIERNDEDTSIIQAVVHSDPRVWNSNLPVIRATRMTLLNYHEAIMNSAVHRRKFCFLTLSSFTEETRKLIDAKKKATEVHFCSELNEHLPQLSIWSIVAFGIALLISLVTSTFLKNTIIAPSDLALGAFVGSLCALVTIVYSYYFVPFNISDKLSSRDSSQARAGTLYMMVISLMSLMVPVALVSFRVTILDDLASPSRKISSICDIYADQLSPSQFLDNSYLNSLAAASSVSPPANAVSQQQCDLPPSLLPSKIASSTFVHFPEGTKFLYHPPLLGQNLPFTSRFDASTSKCQITRNETLAFTNESYRQTKSQITRGNMGYYTILSSPSSCQQQNSVLLQPNTTFLIITDTEFSGCPYWSVNSNIQVGKLSFNQTYESLEANIHPRLQPVLRNQSASDALQAASEISSELEKAIEDDNYNGTNAPIVRMPCQHASNSLVEVKNNNFYLRVASGFSPHFSASYYNERESVWSDARTWKDSTDDYKKNGIVALMADASIFIAHESPAVSDTVPNLLSSPFSSSSASANPSVWTQATPEGLDYLQNIFYVGYIVLVLVMVIIFLYTATFNLFFSRGMNRGIWNVLAAFFAFFIILFPLPTLVITSICESNAVDLDKDELLQPVFCLMGNVSDIRGAWIFTIITFIISCLVLIAGTFIVCMLSRRRDEDEDYM